MIIISYHIISIFISYHIISIFISYHININIISYHINIHIISYHIISIFISYHIISYIISNLYHVTYQTCRQAAGPQACFSAFWARRPQISMRWTLVCGSCTSPLAPMPSDSTRFLGRLKRNGCWRGVDGVLGVGKQTKQRGLRGLGVFWDSNLDQFGKFPTCCRTWVAEKYMLVTLVFDGLVDFNPTSFNNVHWQSNMRWRNSPSFFVEQQWVNRPFCFRLVHLPLFNCQYLVAKSWIIINCWTLCGWINMIKPWKKKV